MQNFYTKHKLYKINELEKLCDKWGERKRVNAVNNIKYYKTFYPNKHSIYQEMMSNKMLLTIKDTISKTDQLIDYMGNCTPKINIVDYRSELLVAKSEAVLYRKQDTHWNNYGAFIAYEKLMKVVSKSFTEIKPKKIEDFNINWREEYFHTDLIGTMGLKWVKFKDVFPKFTLKDKNQNKIRNLKTNGFPLKTIIHENSAVENDLVVVVFRDSYTLALQQFFSLTFKKVYYIWTPYNQKIIDKVNPDLIIDGHVERDMEFK